MGLFSNQFSNVIEWEEFRDDMLFWKWDNKEIKKGSKRLSNLLLPIIKTIKYQLDMKRIVIFTVAVITLTLTACGNKTQGWW